MVAWMVIGKTPLAVGVPESKPADDRVTPPGSGPISVKVGAGDGGAGDRGKGMTLARRDMALMLTHGLEQPGSRFGRAPTAALQ